MNFNDGATQSQQNESNRNNGVEPTHLNDTNLKNARSGLVQGHRLREATEEEMKFSDVQKPHQGDPNTHIYFCTSCKSVRQWKDFFEHSCEVVVIETRKKYSNMRKPAIL